MLHGGAGQRNSGREQGKSPALTSYLFVRISGEEALASIFGVWWVGYALSAGLKQAGAGEKCCKKRRGNGKKDRRGEKKERLGESLTRG